MTTRNWFPDRVGGATRLARRGVCAGAALGLVSILGANTSASMSISAYAGAGIQFKSASDSHWHGTLPTGSYTHLWNLSVDGAGPVLGTITVPKPNGGAWENATASSPLVMNFPFHSDEDGDICLANSSATVKHWFVSTLGPNKYYHSGNVQVYAHAAVVPNKATSAGAYATLEDPWSFTRPSDEDWDLEGRAALGGDMGTSLTGDIDLQYLITFSGESSSLWDIHIGMDETGAPIVTMTVAPGVTLSVDGTLVQPSFLVSKMLEQMNASGWSSSSDFGENLDNAFYFDWSIRLASTVPDATVSYSLKVAAADAAPAPGSVALVAVAGLGLLAMRRRQ